MEKITNFVCFKNAKKEKDTQPDYRLSAKVGSEYETIGGGWIKEGKDGSKFISFQLNKPNGARNGFQILVDKAPLQPEKTPENEITADNIDF